MKNTTGLLLAAFFISFLGSLPLGTLNVSVAQLSIASGGKTAAQFSAGVIFIELLTVLLSIVAIDKLRNPNGYTTLLSWLSVLVVLVLAIFYLQAAWQMRKFEETLPYQRFVQPFLFGMLLSAINPLHLPFWAGWTALLKQKGLLDARPRSIIFYLTGIGIGTSTVFILYAWLGKTLIRELQAKQYLVNWIIGLVLLITAFILFYKSMRRKVKEFQTGS